FILYRQHHQAQVVQQNPGLANPEISKIIGEQWRLESEERKNQWKLLAEEEKQRHQHMYPDYRYQPRRGNKTAGAQSTRPAPSPGQDPHHCPNCGGRYIATPRTPSTPFTTPTSSTKPGSTPHVPPFPQLGQHHHPSGLASRADMSRYSRAPPQHWGSSSFPTPGSLYDVQEDCDRAIMSPNEAKRRRYNAAGSYHNFHALPSPPPPYPQPGGGATSAHPHPRQSSFSNPPTPASYAVPTAGLPGPSSMLPPRSSPPGPMPPPPRPLRSVPVAGQQYPGGAPTPSFPRNSSNHNNNNNNNSSSSRPGFDECLRLPPLQTHLPTSPDTTGSEPSTGGPGTAGTGRDAAARSVEAMVMSISSVNKLRVLERISPPLGADESDGFGGRRGPVIAVEGPDQRLVRAVAKIVERALRAGSPAAEGGWEVRCWEDGSVQHQQQQQQREGEDVSMVHAAAGLGSASRQGSQASSSSIAASPSLGSSTHGSINPFTAYLGTIADWHAKSAEIVQFVTGATRQPPPTTTTTTKSQPPQTHNQGQNNDNKKPLPIALLPSGFSLSLADRFACAVPIADAYAPVDHWQWMATLWRGIVGADLVVYVSPRVFGQGHASSAVVPVDEKIERRLGFEVVEWVRGAGWAGSGRGIHMEGSHAAFESFLTF
ncbi:hypothetical protein N658DRAFT_424535, partial [Parathielavia hyrcaniae]